MKITVKELRNGHIIVRNQQVLQVVEFQNLNDIYRLQVINYSLHEKQVLDIGANEELEMISLTACKAQFNYSEGDIYYFFNLDTYEEIEIEKGTIYNEKWLKEGHTCTLHSYNGKVIKVDLARFIDIRVIKIESGVPPIAILENGVKVKVGSQVGIGDIIRVDTITETYIG